MIASAAYLKVLVNEYRITIRKHLNLDFDRWVTNVCNTRRQMEKRALTNIAMHINAIEKMLSR